MLCLYHKSIIYNTPVAYTTGNNNTLSIVVIFENKPNYFYEISTNRDRNIKKTQTPSVHTRSPTWE